MFGGRFGDSGSTVLIEDRIAGPEASLFALIDGPDAIFMGSAQDHKRAFDNDRGRTPAAWAPCRPHRG